MDLLGDRGPTKHVPALEHEDLAPRLRKVRRIDQPVVPAANDDNVVFSHCLKR